MYSFPAKKKLYFDVKINLLNIYNNKNMKNWLDIIH